MPVRGSAADRRSGWSLRVMTASRRSAGADARAKVHAADQAMKIVRMHAEQPRRIGVAVTGTFEGADDQVALGLLEAGVIVQRLRNARYRRRRFAEAGRE